MIRIREEREIHPLSNLRQPDIGPIPQMESTARPAAAGSFQKDSAGRTCRVSRGDYLPYIIPPPLCVRLAAAGSAFDCAGSERPDK